MRIQHSMPAINNHLQQRKKHNSLTKTLEKLSSGYCINRAADNAAGLTISEGMRAQIRGLEKGMKNTMDGISLIQVADSALGEVHQYLHRMRDLAVQAANDTLVAEDRQLLQLEIDQLKQSIDKIANDTEFNTIKLLNRAHTQTITTSTSVTTLVPFTKTETISTGPIGNTTLNFNTTISKGTTFVEFTLNINTQNSTNFPDLSIISPNGNSFGYNLSYLSSTQYATNTTNTSSSKATYSGYESSPEIFTFENPRLGNWALRIVGANNLTSNYTLSATFSGTEEVTTTNIITTTIQANNSLKIHVGPNQNQALAIQLANVLCENIGIDQLNIATQQGANNAIHQLDQAIQTVSNERSKFGSYMNRLEYTHNSLATYQENLSHAESTIRDADLAKEYSSLIKEQLLLQGETAMFSTIQNNNEHIFKLLY